MQSEIENIIPETEPRAIRNLNIWADKISGLRDLAASFLFQSCKQEDLIERPCEINPNCKNFTIEVHI